MKQIATRLAALAAIALLSSMTARAETPQGTEFTYQGQLKNSGSPSSGSFNMVFTLWNDPLLSVPANKVGPTLTFDGLGGNPAPVTVTNGLFTVALDFGVNSYAANQARWLEIAVSGTPLSPRQALTSTPFALNTRGLNVDGSGNVGIGASAPAANLDVGGGVRVQAIVGGRGGEVRTFDEGGNYQSIIQPDVHGSGVFVFLARDTLADGLTFDGNNAGSGNPRLDLFGASPMTFNTNATGNGSVTLPADAVASGEISDEPGVANNHVSTVALAPALAAVASRTITVPAAGFVLVLAQGDLQINHTAGIPMNCNYGVSASSSSLPADQDVQTQIPSALSAGTYDFSASAHGLFEVAAAGAFTGFFVANKSNNGDTANMFDIQLTLVYFPTAYGTVTSNFAGGERLTGGSGPTPASIQPNDAALARAPLSDVDIVAERADAAASHATRLEREMAQMRQQLAAMQAHLEQLQREQGRIRQLPPEAPGAAAKSGSAGEVPVMAKGVNR